MTKAASDPSPRPDVDSPPPRLDVRLTEGAIEIEPLWQEIAEDDAGAHFVFVGKTRRRTGDRVTQQLAYEAFRPMAESELHELLRKASHTFGLSAAVAVHRLGPVAVGEASIAVAVSSAHRQVGFDAVAWIMDEVKRSVPIWKQEHFTDGSSEWIHRIQDD